MEDQYTSEFFKLSSSQDSAFSELDSSPDNTENSLSLSQITLEEIPQEEPRIVVPSFYNITPRHIPVSPHLIFEEEFSNNPWAVLVATIFLAKTSGKLARPVMKAFFERYPTPYHILDSNPKDLEAYFDRLGLKKRAVLIWRMTRQFISANWRRAGDLHGIGKYGEDAYRIFCLGHTDLEPSDRYLRLYLDWLVSHTDFLVENCAEDCENVLEDPVTEYYRLSL